MRNFNRLFLIIAFLIAFDIFIWWQVVFYGPNKNTEIYALDVGQGDAELVILPGGMKVLIDGGPTSKILEELSSVLRPLDRYIDLVVMSHPQTDHFTGLIDVLKRYKVGAFISSGKSGAVSGFRDLKAAIEKNKIPVIALHEGDGIRYKSGRIDILSPSPSLLMSAEPNDWALVIRLKSEKATALFTGDIDSKIEESLIKKYDADIDILKVAHHGSKFSSSEEFLMATTPRVALIEVGKNTYGHPTPQILGRLASVGSRIFRTDKDGTIKLVISSSTINFFHKRD